MSRMIAVEEERFEISGGFAIARGSRTHAEVISVRIEADDHIGCGECVPYARYGETLASVRAQIEAIAADLQSGLTRQDLQGVLAPGAARNAVDCALWDLEAKQSGKRAYAIAGLESLKPVTTAFTISVGTPESMAKKTALAAHRPLLKIKLGGDGDAERIAAVRSAAPESTLIVDANEAWDAKSIEPNLRACDTAGVSLIEQPLPAGKDDLLQDIHSTVTICADESVHTRDGLAALRNRYDAVNIKLDKTGGLTEAMELLKAAKALDFKIMTGCMVGTSLAMAPAVLLAQEADYVDLDGPLLLAKDREPGLVFEDSLLHPPAPELWG